MEADRTDIGGFGADDDMAAVAALPDADAAFAEDLGRLSFFLSGIDFSLSALHTWNKMPVVCGGIGQYRRMTMLGADCSLPLGRFVLRGEVAEYLDEANQGDRLLDSDQNQN